MSKNKTSFWNDKNSESNNPSKEEKVEKVEEPKAATPEPAAQVLLSNTDAYVNDRMRSQPKTIEEVDVKVSEKDEPGKHRLTLPDELNEHEKKYTFRWIFKNKQAIDHACDVRGWVLVNRVYFPDIPRHLFSVSGSMERGDMILAFMDKNKAARLRSEPGETSKEIVDSMLNKHKDDPRYYTPQDEDGGRVVGL